MNALPALVRSLFLASLLSFVLPWASVGLGWVSLRAIAIVPELGAIARSSMEAVRAVLSTFGSGHPLAGLMAIALAFSFVGAMFDTFAFYRDGAWRRTQ